MNIVKVENCSKVFKNWRKEVVALNNVSFEIKEGNVYGLIGPNGAGKTTLIKVLLGLLKPSSGVVELFGESKINSKIKEKIGFLPEESYLYDFLSIRETVEFSSKIYANRASTFKKVDEVLELVGVKDRSDRKISDCSKGMVRRAALASTLIHDPDFIILDEPTSGFDPVGVADMKSIIQTLKSKKKTIFLCSHQLNDVQEVCDHIFIMYQGNLVLKGDISELLQDHSNDLYEIINNNDKDVSEILSENNIQFTQSKREHHLENLFIQTIKKWVSK